MRNDEMSIDRPGHALGEKGAYRPRHDAGAGFPRARTALLIIDPVNDFLSEGGAAWEMTRNTVRLHNVVENLRRAIDGARRHGIPVLFGPMAYTEEDYAEHALHRRSGINRLMFETKMFLAGSWGADFHPDLQPADGDVVLLPHKGTDVFETDLPQHLERLGTTHLVIAGMTANLCCESTGRHATEHGYDVTFLADAIGSESIPSWEAAVRVNYPLIANGVLEVDDFLAAIEGGDAAAEVRVGDTIRGSDHLEIGTVKEVVAASDAQEAYMRVPRGLIFEKESYIPLDAVVRRAGDTVFINIPKLVVGKMPWGEPPSRAEREQKVGPPADLVERLYGSRSPTGAEGPQEQAR